MSQRPWRESGISHPEKKGLGGGRNHGSQEQCRPGLASRQTPGKDGRRVYLGGGLVWMKFAEFLGLESGDRDYGHLSSICGLLCHEMAWHS